MTEATNNTSALLPCPFCGGTNLEVHGKPGILNAHDDIGCNDCDAFTPEPTWNRRAPPAAAVVTQCLQHFLDHKFTQLAVFEDGRTPLYLTEEQYNSIRSLLARLNPAPVEQSAMVVPEGYALVPLEPTEAMIDVAVSHALMVSLSGDYNWSAYMRDAWLRMLAAAPTPEPASPQTGAASDVLAERQRQITAEGWAASLDDQHTAGQLAAAAACYALWAGGINPANWGVFWPWDRVWLKNGEPRRMLVKAGALILAEIERLDRAEQPAKEQGQ